MKLVSSVLIATCLWPVFGEEKLDHPVGLVTAAKDARLLRAHANLPLTAQPGDILFAGDSLQSTQGAWVEFLFCPAASSQKLTGPGEIELGAQELRVKRGAVSDVITASVCDLPLVERSSVAEERHYGASLDVTSTPAADSPATLEVALAQVPAVARQLANLDQTIRSRPDDLAAHVARAAVLERAGLHRQAAQEYAAILNQWPDAVWAGSRAFVNQEQGRGLLVPPPAAGLPGGRTYALIVGISSYQDPAVPQLHFAHADAELFEKHLRSPRGGALTDSQITVLTNEKATLAAVRSAIVSLPKLKAGKNDTVVLFIAAHGTSMGRDGYILTTDSILQNLENTALPMSLVQDVFQKSLNAVGRVVLYVDACHAGKIGTIREVNRITDIVMNIAEENDMFGILASRKNQQAYEGPEWGGHGVFSRYLVEALNGAARNSNGTIDAVSVAEYVQRQVEQATQRKQQPREIGNADNTVILADWNRGGLDLDKLVGPTLTASTNLPAGRAPSNTQSPDDQEADASAEALKGFDAALAAGRVLPDSSGSAFSYLPALRRGLSSREYISETNRLRVKLEDLGQQILLTYLRGEESPQTPAEFRRGVSIYEAARQLTQESLLLRARSDFFQGRVALFDKQYGVAIPLLERAVRADSAAAYPYNALGIAYLSQANYEYAAGGFRDAIQRAPYWAYPRYNLALTLADEGDYAGAEREYREAIRLAPGYAYVHYGLALLLHKLGRRSEAAREYQLAIDANPNRAEPYLGRGALEMFFGKKTKAEQDYRTAIKLDPALPAAAHDLGLLYAREGKTDLALQTWVENATRNPGFVPSRMSLAKAYRDRGRYDLAIEQYQAVLVRSAGYAAAVLALHETLGDQARQAHQPLQARREYTEALKTAVSDEDRKRLARKARE
jgi:tetratricopeptide (TPR) repeat protein